MEDARHWAVKAVERVGGGALSRLGLPTARDFTTLTESVDRLEKRVDDLVKRYPTARKKRRPAR